MWWRCVPWCAWWRWRVLIGKVVRGSQMAPVAFVLACVCLRCVLHDLVDDLSE